MTRSEASRVNGAKSRGPKTPEGRARSSQNARKHGVLVHAVVLRNEDPEQYDALAREYYARYGPDGLTLMREGASAPAGTAAR